MSFGCQSHRARQRLLVRLRHQWPVDTWRKVENDNGETFYIRTAGETLYALEPLPKGYFDAVGIVGYADKRYYLRLTNKEIREHK